MKKLRRSRRVKIPLIVWKYFPKKFCLIMNQIFHFPVFGRRRLQATWSVESKEDLRKLHGLDIENQIRETMTVELERSLNN